ncbi:type IV pilin N-terminal domain-containing protein [Halorarum halobium]|uniref:type IV pilin N-terminal domain-containing protein n=1 Tax=Halorarum halobium TaxID=3075121 RepID=UPI0028A640E0|nr:type IV pilin N-terminal domain-containing protein [Halobaculum sp. XH14]
MSSRASAPAVGIALLLLVAVGLSATVGAAAFGVAGTPADPAPVASLSLAIDDGALVFEHGGGDTLDVRTLHLRVSVANEELTHQPPIPFFAARGFVSGPTGPFNVADDPRWSAGERARVEPAGTNEPAIRPGVTVTVDVYVDAHRLVRLTAIA